MRQGTIHVENEVTPMHADNSSIGRIVSVSVSVSWSAKIQKEPTVIGCLTHGRYPTARLIAMNRLFIGHAGYSAAHCKCTNRQVIEVSGRVGQMWS